jgi:HAD superfamily hydrolase (TIGR01549 family)
MSVIVFDLDGVLIPESEEFKRRAWLALFQSDMERAAFDIAEANFGRGRGGDRFTILSSTYEALGFAGLALEKRVQDSAARFDKLVQQMIAEAGLPADAVELLSKLAEAGNRLYVNSATPQMALDTTIDALGLDAYLTAALGRPRPKPENFALISMIESVSPLEMIFIGDSASDLAAAQEFGCCFIMFRNAWSDWVPEDAQVPVVSTFTELRHILR